MPSSPSLSFDPSDLDPGSTVLVLASPGSAARRVACTALLTPAPPAETRVLAVALTDTPADVTARYERRVDGGAPATFCVVTPEAHARGEATNASLPATTVATVDDPGNLTALGVRLTERLEAWGDAPHQPVLGLDSVSTLLQYASRETVYAFLHTLGRRVHAAGALAHYHMDPDAHDDTAIATFVSLVDGVVRPTADGIELAT